LPPDNLGRFDRPPAAWSAGGLVGGAASRACAHVGPLTLGAEEDQQLRRRGTWIEESVRSVRVELGGFAGRQDDVVVTE